MMVGRAVIGDAGMGDLSGLSVAELAGLWKLHLTERLSAHLPRSVLPTLLSYRLQVEQHGELSKKAVAYL